jgi:hypothetical protein
LQEYLIVCLLAFCRLLFLLIFLDIFVVLLTIIIFLKLGQISSTTFGLKHK